MRFLSSDGNEDPMVVGRTLCSAGGGGSVDWGSGGGEGHGAPLLAKQHQRCWSEVMEFSGIASFGFKVPCYLIRHILLNVRKS